jgi:hypothetical protein
MNIDHKMTLRDVTLAKLSRSIDEGVAVPFELREAKLAGMFVEDAIGMDDLDEEELQEID